MLTVSGDWKRLHVVLQLLAQILPLAGIINENDFLQQRPRRAIDDAPNRPQERRPRFVVEHDNDGRGWQFAGISFRATAEKKGEKNFPMIRSARDKKPTGLNSLCRTSDSERFSQIMSLARRLNWFSLNFSFISSCWCDFIFTGLPISPGLPAFSRTTGAGRHFFSSTERYVFDMRFSSSSALSMLLRFVSISSSSTMGSSSTM